MSTIALVGASGSGKSLIEKEIKKAGYKKIISYTTREPRKGEENGKDYWFVNKETFKQMLNEGVFAEYEEYSQGRFYGTLRSDYLDGENKVVVLTPNGIRQINKTLNIADIFTVFVEANVGTRIIRYINRVGINNFTMDDKTEICNRIERDWAMFLGIQNDVDYIVTNNEGKDIKEVVKEILNA